MEAQLRWVSGSISLSGGPLPGRPEQDGKALEAGSYTPPASPAAIDHAGVDSGWAGVVVPRTSLDEPTESAASPEPHQQASDQETPQETATVEPHVSELERRQRLVDYRSQLSSLQASLSELHAASDTPEEPFGSDADEEQTH